MTNQSEALQIVGPKNKFPEVSLIEPAQSGYLLLAIEVDHRPSIGFFVESKAKKKLLGTLKALAQKLGTTDAGFDATVFKAVIIPPGRGAFLNKRPEVKIAKFDVVLLVEFVTVDAAKEYQKTPEWAALVADIKENSHNVMSIAASNARRIGPVDHATNGIFLFNYFYADSLDVNLQVWNYTAGWFQDQTGLDNSTVLLPDDATQVPYTIINHCRWDGLRNILPALLFNRSFKPFVLDNFEQNNTAAIPILYKLA
ncbi:hypothetical protein [Nisaea sp.]|uniref:hypothetical protein n=1 Tax=Nisaea sp. TaxID=2024842 RepID=UPI003299D84C